MGALRIYLAAAGLAVAAAQSTAPTPTPAPDKHSCMYTPNIPNINFNACGSAVYGQDYIWADPTDVDTRNSTYYFNLGLNVKMANIAACPTAQIVSPAIQVAQVGSNKVCTSLSAPANPLKTTYFSQNVFDTTNPAKGWQLTYINVGGQQTCLNGNPASFTLTLLCGNRPFPSPGVTQIGYVVETASSVSGPKYVGCEYEAMAYSLAGCPTQCPLVNGQLCGNNGICGYDDTAGTARCFCYSNWMESDCQTPRTPFPGGAVAGATIGGILVGLAVVLGISWYMRGSSKPVVAAGEGFYAA